MSNEAAKARLAELMQSVQAGIGEIARMQREHAKITASATAARRRVTVTVNADGDVIETRIAPNTTDLTHEQLAQAFTKAAQDAAAQVRRRTREMVAEVQQNNARLPRLSEFVPGVADMQDLLPRPPEPSLEPPKARHRVTHTEEPEEPATSEATEFTDFDVSQHDSGSSASGGVLDSGW
ncbi:YbaB/EbfC family nucleoid-associated protein [Nocardia sp. CA2R105]|uniref:YbaB/EbfC family nucleoid-associated protein n=1 Tax=Nocardia coffeae TaxID=2873381 RepID=UPI001CA6EF23|nr:YbaB/EbfC family nucleoid-associated protein [Nocardia coffeae]MBY8860889.1 YbaB/EbfC family nucleoid-associated protein [Nocardia coffeae]